MRQRSIVLSVGLLVIVVLSLFSWGATTQAAQAVPSPIRLQAATFIPTAGQQPAFAPGLTIEGYAPNTRGYYIVQFIGPVEASWKGQVTKLGGEILEYIPITLSKCA